MKKSLLFSIVWLLATVSCVKDVDNEGEGFDLKASKMEQIGSLFDSIARQPESADVLIKATEILYKDYTELLPLSDRDIIQRGKARGSAFSSLFDAIARQPEAFDDLDYAAEKFLGVYDPDYISDDLLEITRIYSLTALEESLARQPEAKDLINSASIKYLDFDILDHDE